MSEVTVLPALGWRTPFVALTDAIVTWGASERGDLHKAWWSAATQVNRVLDVDAWARRILPEHSDVLFCVRPLFRRLRTRRFSSATRCREWTVAPRDRQGLLAGVG